jgi:hypothetical protein
LESLEPGSPERSGDEGAGPIGGAHATMLPRT